MNEYMKMAREQAEKGMKSNEGGPFGAVITDKDGNIISVANNQVLKIMIQQHMPKYKLYERLAKSLIHMIYLDIFYIHLANHVQCVYLQLFGQILKKYIMLVLEKMQEKLVLEMTQYMNF